MIKRKFMKSEFRFKRNFTSFEAKVLFEIGVGFYPQMALSFSFRNNLLSFLLNLVSISGSWHRSRALQSTFLDDIFGNLPPMLHIEPGSRACISFCHFVESPKQYQSSWCLCRWAHSCNLENCWRPKFRFHAWKCQSPVRFFHCLRWNEPSCSTNLKIINF